MSSGRPRRRTSVLNSSEAEVTELRRQLLILNSDSDVPREDSQDTEQLHARLSAAHCVRQALLDDNSSRHTRDSFRHLNGFQIVLTALKTTLKNSEVSLERTEAQLMTPDLLQAFFGVLTAALQDHNGNERYFKQRIEGGGWALLQSTLMDFIVSTHKRPLGPPGLMERTFGCLLSCALNDESVLASFSTLKRRLDATRNSLPSSSLPAGDTAISINESAANNGSLGRVDESISWMDDLLETEIGSSAIVQNPDAILVMVEIWKALRNFSLTENESQDAVCHGVPRIVNYLVTSSISNWAALHNAGLLGVLLPCLLDSRPNGSCHDPGLPALAATLLRHGIGNLDDAHFMYRYAHSSSVIADLLLSSLKSSHVPSYVHFDLSRHGYASIELPGIGRTFPPVGVSAGYTLSLWIQITRFDPNSHTTIFGAFDASQTCFVLVYLEKDTHNLILQTSVTSSRPSVRFKLASFGEGRWYHVAITHRRPKSTSSSRASLFIDGEFVEQVKSQYPATPPLVKPTNENEASPSTSRKNNAIQAFLGTPQDLASRLGKGLVLSQWRLSSAHLFADVLSDDLIAVYFELGPRYTGNFQDCLGSFQTYQASAALNLRNESLHPGKEEKSDVVSAIRSKAGTLLPENKVLLNISATVVLDDNQNTNSDEMQPIKSLSKIASKNMHNITRGGRNALAINGAIPSIDEALLHSSGFAVLTGDPTLVVPQSLDDAAWRIGGCAPVGLALLDASNEPEEIVRALDILFESIRENWRNSEAMERENGFGVLASLLTVKLTLDQNRNIDRPSSPITPPGEKDLESKLSLKVLAAILKFVGFQAEKPEESVINNPLAYRILLVDMELWRTSPPTVQKLYYEQFLTFASRSKYHQFNAKRLLRMRIIKKWLEVLKGDPFTNETFEYFLSAFKVLLTPSLSADSMRSLALYITYAIHKPKEKHTLPARGKSVKLKIELPTRRQTLSSAPARHVQQPEKLGLELTQLQVALKILKMYAELLCQNDDIVNIRKFARTVTNKWLLHLLADDESAVVVLAAKILARLLVVSGPAYVKKFVEKTGGMIVMQHRLKRWWSIPAIWSICFAVFFGVDVGKIDFARSFDLFNLLEIFASDGQVKVVYPDILAVLTSMLQKGLISVTRDQSDPDSPLTERGNGKTSIPAGSQITLTHERHRSISLSMEAVPTSPIRSVSDQLVESASLLRTITRFLADIHTKSQAFRDFTASSSYVQELFLVLFPVVVSANPLSPEMELHARDSALTFKGNDVIMRPLSASSMKSAPVVRTATVERNQNLKPPRIQAPRRMSAYVMVTSDHVVLETCASTSQPVVSPIKAKATFNLSSTIVEELLELTIAVFSNQIFGRKDFPGLGLFMRVPPGFQEHQAYFETFILRNALSQLGNNIKLDQKLLWEPRVLTNLARFATHLGEAIFEGWFINGSEDTLDFLAHILEYLQLPDVASIKTVRLCSQVISNIRAVLLRVVLLRLSEVDETSSATDAVSFLNKLTYWQTVLQSAEDPQIDFLRMLCYLLYNKLTDPNERVRMAAANIWRMLLVHKPDETSAILQQAGAADNSSLIRGFKKIMELDNEAFLSWVEEHRQELNDVVFNSLSNTWETLVAAENRNTEDTAKARTGKRREKLSHWVSENVRNEEILRRHETSTDHWRSNIYAAENLKRQRALQDQQDSQLFNTSTWAKMSQELRRPCGVLSDTSPRKWQLDQTEGRNRMRLRLIPDNNAHAHDYQPKRRQSQSAVKLRRSTASQSKPANQDVPPVPNLQAGQKAADAHNVGSPTPEATATAIDDEIEGAEGEDDFEMVDNPRGEAEDYEDKNRKVMRSLQRGDQVEHVNNVSRIVGLEAVEGLLILGKAYLYLLDSLFQLADGEIVNVWQAPKEERDPYLQMISGRETGDQPSTTVKVVYETRSWRWEDVLSISKRRFLFRDVAIEVFFVDGRSYLLTFNTPVLRDELYQKLLGKATNVADRATSTSGEDSWRIESVRNPEDETQTFGSRFTSVFAQAASNPATRKWMRGEISNFHYLMLVNTMAGRTFNDLTQYPVFPWVLADYTSKELDLSDPRSFRDLSKPMGCQTFERQTEFKERYQSFAEMGDENAPPFHYGTHYSSAMIVTSYLIRLQPFVHSYLLLQGGSFDHPDRLFFSIKKAWASASRDNMTDVRELIPEFFYLPEFLLNTNEYDFGTRQGSGGTIDTVDLPPWAKGDPKIFISKHREALESDHVSQHLHQWIDLVFGHKQRGEAALEATNVFHHLSYHGAKDLDTINDPVERLATIGIIHNFGQTPHQVFQRAHPPREDGKHKVKRLDSAAENLTRLPFPVFESHDRISTLQYSKRHERLLCSGPFKFNIGPAYDKYMEWGFIDGSVRFYNAESKKLIGLFEHIHQGQLSCALFADSKTLITAGADCTVSVWAVISTSKSVDLQPKKCLFGHRRSLTILAVSKSFSALMSASSDGQVILWDLNRLELVRILTSEKPVECALINDVTGVIMLCRGSEVSLWTINGDLILEQNIYVEGDDMVSSCAFYEGSGNEYLERNLIFTGHRRGVVNVWNTVIRNGSFVLEHVKRMHHMDQAGFNIGASITSILPMAQLVYTGDDDGRVYEWDCIQRQ